MKVPVALKLEVSYFSFLLLGFDGDRTGTGNAFWFGASGEDWYNILSHCMFCFVLSQFTGIIECCVWEGDGFLFGGGFLTSLICIVSTSSWICG